MTSFGWKSLAVFVGLIAVVIAIKALQFNSCRSDGLSFGTCTAVISR